MKIYQLALPLMICIGFSTACGQNNQTSNQSKEIKIPSSVKKTDYEKNPDESLLLLTLNSDGQVFYQDKPLDDSALKNVLAEYNEKHKNDPSTTDSKYPSMYDDKFKSFYLKADAGLPFSQILKVLKAVRESSATSYRAKFIVKPQETDDKAIETPKSRYVVKIDLGEKPVENSQIPRPNPLLLVANLGTDGKIKFYNIYNTSNNSEERSEFLSRLREIFKQREKNGTFREDTMDVEKTVFLVTSPDVKYGDVIKFIDELNETGANPIKFGDLLKGKGSSGVGDGSGSGGGVGRGSGSGRGEGRGEGAGVGTGSSGVPPVKKP